eukprot:362747-Chlamydomonas_euryale.AAC.5
MHGGVASGAGGGGGGDALLVLGGSGPSDHDMGHDMGLPSDEALVQAPLAGMGIDVDDVDDMRGLLAGDGPPPAGMDALDGRSFSCVARPAGRLRGLTCGSLAWPDLRGACAA